MFQIARAGAMARRRHPAPPGARIGHMTRPVLTVWFDGACPLCTAEIALMRRLDAKGAIDFIDVASPDATCPIDRAELLARFHAREAGGPIVSGAEAFAAMWRAIPLLRPLGFVAKFPPALWLLERAYRLFLRARPAIVRGLRRAVAQDRIAS
jgi:predicted DCC family thiol-disulfide oxidoreductase YuxK